MSDFTFLTEEQCFGDEQLDILKKRGTRSAITDFSVLLGGNISDSYHIVSDSSLEGRTGYYWIKSYDENSDTVCSFNADGSRRGFFAYNRSVGARPVLPFSSISKIPINGKSGKRTRDGILEVEYGYYPQKAVSRDMQERLEREYRSGSIPKTRNSYTTDSRRHFNEEFASKQHEEYEYNGKRYVRVEANFCYIGGKSTLSNGGNYRVGDNVWVEVSPVKWLVDEKSKMMITEKIIFAGVQFNKESNYHTRDFDKTDIKTFMDRYLARDLVQSRGTITYVEQTEEREDTAPQRKSRLQKLNPDKTKTADRTRMTDTEIIQNWIEAGESVLLRGPSGIGKTERIKTLYPDLIYMKLTNNMFPEKVVGSVNLQTGQALPPDFAKTAIMQEATAEERKAI